MRFQSADPAETQLYMETIGIQPFFGMSKQPANTWISPAVGTIEWWSLNVLKLKNENDQLRETIDSLKKDIADGGQREQDRLKEELKKVTTEKQAIERDNRELSAQVAALHAKPPEVITRVEEVENASTRRQLQEVQVQAAKLQVQVEVLQEERANVDNRLQEAQRRISELENDCGEKAQLLIQVAELQQEISQKNTQLATSYATIDSLEEKLKSLEEEMRVIEEQLHLEIDNIQRSKKEELEVLRNEYENRMTNLNNSVKLLQSKLSVIQPALSGLYVEYKELKQQCYNMPQLLQEEVKRTTKQICKALSEVNKYNQELVRKYRKEMALRKKYHNELVELKGNIRVFCRVRPRIKEDGTGPQSAMVVNFDEEDDCLVNVSNKGRTQSFELDRIFDESISQTQVFEEVSALVTSCIDGFNVCIFAYGQTGSGKTHTMEGNKDDPGINQRALIELFKETSERSQEWQYSICVSVMEIYNEQLRDLLSDDPSKKLEVKLGPDGTLHVPGLGKEEVRSVDDVNRVFQVGQINRATASTNMNEHSSRSHAILRITTTGINTTTGVKTTGHLNLVDLAGSERVSKSGADGARLKEAQNINKSLACLGDVIQALRAKQNFVPYRNSKLTYLLQDSLGGDSKTLMIVQVSPVEKNVLETCASLSFAQRVRSVELGQASKKVENAELIELREKLANYEGQENGFSHSMNGKTPTKLPTPAKTPGNRWR